MNVFSKYLCLSFLLLGACAEHGGAQLSTAHSSARNVFGPGSSIPMAEFPLEAQGDFDALETHFLARMGVEKLIPVYGELAEKADPKSNARDALLLQRLALLHLRSSNDSGRLHQAFAVADRLRTQAPESPHTLYLLGHITSLLLPVDAGVLRIQPSQQDVARRLVQHWEGLLSLESDYLAPSGQKGSDIRVRLNAIKTALARSEKTPATDVHAETPTREVPNEVLDERRRLHRLENGDQAVRRTLCRERKERGESDVATQSEAGRWLALRCAVELEDGGLGRQAVKELLDSGASIQPCGWLERLGEKVDDVDGELKAAMQKRDIPLCSPREN